MSSLPYEIVTTPGEVWVAAVGATYPLPEVAPNTGTWTKLGTAGKNSYDESGISIDHSGNRVTFRGYGSVGEIKAKRTEENLVVAFNLVDVSLEQYKWGLNAQSVATVAGGGGTAAYKKIVLASTMEIPAYALLIRFDDGSPYGTGWNMQYELPQVRPWGDPTVVYDKGGFPAVNVQFKAFWVSDAVGFGRLNAQSAAVT